MDRKDAMEFLMDQGVNLTEYEGKPFAIVPAWGNVEKDPRFDDAMETVLGQDHKYDWGFSDSWSTCSHCYDAIETQPNSYGWKPDYWLDETAGEMLCGDCIRGYRPWGEEYIQDRISKARQGKAVGVYIVDPKEYGFVMIAQGLTHGLHEGQNEDPRKLLPWAEKQGLDILFDVSPGQFDVSFDVYMRPERSETDIMNETPYETLTGEQVDEIRNAILAHQGKYSDGLRQEFRQYPTPADNAKRALKGLTKPYASIDTDTGETQEYDTIEEYMAHMQRNR